KFEFAGCRIVFLPSAESPTVSGQCAVRKRQANGAWWLARDRIDDSSANAMEPLVGNAEIDSVQLSTRADLHHSRAARVHHSGIKSERKTSIGNLVGVTACRIGANRRARPGGSARRDVITPRRHPVHAILATVVGSRRPFHLKYSLAGGVVACAQQLNGNGGPGLSVRT